MLPEIEKARKALSADSEATINIETILDDEGIERVLEIDEFEEIIQPVKDKLSRYLSETLASLEDSLNVSDIGIIELLGDCTRSPFILRLIEEKFERTDLRRTMHSTEFLARGAAVCAAMYTK